MKISPVLPPSSLVVMVTQLLEENSVLHLRRYQVTTDCNKNDISHWDKLRRLDRPKWERLTQQDVFCSLVTLGNSCYSLFLGKSYITCSISPGTERNILWQGISKLAVFFLAVFDSLVSSHLIFDIFDTFSPKGHTTNFCFLSFIFFFEWGRGGRCVC